MLTMKSTEKRIFLNGCHTEERGKKISNLLHPTPVVKLKQKSGYICAFREHDELMLGLLVLFESHVQNRF